MNKEELETKYAQIEEDDLLKLHAQGTLTESAYDVLEAELTSRGLAVPIRPELKPPSYLYDRSAVERNLRRRTYAIYVFAYVITFFFVFDPTQWEVVGVSATITIIAFLIERTKNLLVASIFPIAILGLLIAILTAAWLREEPLVPIVMMTVVPLVFVGIHFFSVIRLTASIERKLSWRHRILGSLWVGILTLAVWVFAVVGLGGIDPRGTEGLSLLVITGPFYFLLGFVLTILARTLRYFSRGVVDSISVPESTVGFDKQKRNRLLKSSLLTAVGITGLWVCLVVGIELLDPGDPKPFTGWLRDGFFVFYAAAGLTILVKALWRFINNLWRLARYT